MVPWTTDNQAVYSGIYVRYRNLFHSSPDADRVKEVIEIELAVTLRRTLQGRNRSIRWRNRSTPAFPAHTPHAHVGCFCSTYSHEQIDQQQSDKVECYYYSSSAASHCAENVVIPVGNIEKTSNAYHLFPVCPSAARHLTHLIKATLFVEEMISRRWSTR